jgi:hypothetical protein
MMMKMLEEGGLLPLTDNLRRADDDNPRGYYEFERVKKLPAGDVAWLSDAEGKVVKVIAQLLTHLPATHDYRVVFMRRAMPEILASQRQMLVRRGENPDKISDAQMAKLFEKHLAHINAWLNSQTNIQRIDVNYNELLREPIPAVARINRFVGGELNEERMLKVVDLTLHRQRG